MTDELKQLAAEHAPNFVTSAYSLGSEEVKPRLEAFGREVQRQTVEAAAKIAHDEGDYFIEKAIRSLLSPAQEVRNG